MMNLGQPRKTQPDTDLNLIPIMNLFVAMIPFLLMSAAFFHLSVVNASVPTIADEDTTIEIEKKNVTMTLQLKTNGFKLSGGNEYLSAGEMAKLKTFLSATSKGYPFEELTQFLASVKQAYPRSETLVLVPEKDVDFQTIIQTMDAARILGEDGEPTSHKLFPNVVVSGIVE